MIWRVEYSPEADMDLEGIHQYIADNLLAPETAGRQANRIMDAILGAISMHI